MKKKLIIRWGLFIIGMLILTFGARMILLSDLGVGGMDAVAIGLSNWTEKSIGVMITGLGVLLVIIGGILNKRLSIFPLGVSLLTGTLYDLWGILIFDKLSVNSSPPYPGCIFLVGLIIAPFGAALYILSQLSTGPIDYIMLAIKPYFKGSLQNSRIFLEMVFVFAGWIIGGPIGVGTICIMLLWGPILQIYYKALENLIKKYIN